MKPSTLTIRQDNLKIIFSKYSNFVILEIESLACFGVASSLMSFPNTSGPSIVSIEKLSLESISEVKTTEILHYDELFILR